MGAGLRRRDASIGRIKNGHCEVFMPTDNCKHCVQFARVTETLAEEARITGKADRQSSIGTSLFRAGSLALLSSAAILMPSFIIWAAYKDVKWWTVATTSAFCVAMLGFITVVVSHYVRDAARRTRRKLEMLYRFWIFLKGEVLHTHPLTVDLSPRCTPLKDVSNNRWHLAPTYIGRSTTSWECTADAVLEINPSCEFGTGHRLYGKGSGVLQVIVRRGASDFFVAEWKDGTGTVGVFCSEEGMVYLLEMAARFMYPGDVRNLPIHLRSALREAIGKLRAVASFPSSEGCVKFARSPYAPLMTYVADEIYSGIVICDIDKFVGDVTEDALFGQKVAVKATKLRGLTPA